MKIANIFLCLVLTQTIFGLKINEKVSRVNVNPFLKTVLNNLKVLQSRAPEVVILKLGLYKNSMERIEELANSVARKISVNNVVLMPDISKILRGQNVKKADVIIIVTDVYNDVSNLSL